MAYLPHLHRAPPASRVRCHHSEGRALLQLPSPRSCRAERSITAMGSGPWVSPLTAPHRRQIKSNKDKESKVYYTEQEGEGLSNTATAIIEVRDAKNPSTDDILRTNKGGCTPPGQPSCG